MSVEYTIDRTVTTTEYMRLLDEEPHSHRISSAGEHLMVTFEGIVRLNVLPPTPSEKRALFDMIMGAGDAIVKGAEEIKEALNDGNTDDR